MIVAGNWKMNGSIASIQQLVSELVERVPAHLVANTLVFPPAIYLPLVADLLAEAGIRYGIQNTYPADSGAYTGEISIVMAKEFAVSHGLVGHSERRHILGESEQFVAQKFHHLKENGIIPVLCVGETLTQREKGLTEQVIKAQIEPVMAMGDLNGAVVAYEPVWAIGTGKTATPEQAQQAHAYIRQLIASHQDAGVADNMDILYGGSVNEKNATALFAMPDIDGGLVGGASLKATQFAEIVKCIK